MRKTNPERAVLKPFVFKIDGYSQKNAQFIINRLSTLQLYGVCEDASDEGGVLPANKRLRSE